MHAYKHALHHIVLCFMLYCKWCCTTFPVHLHIQFITLERLKWTIVVQQKFLSFLTRLTNKNEEVGWVKQSRSCLEHHVMAYGVDLTDWFAPYSRAIPIPNGTRNRWTPLTSRMFYQNGQILRPWAVCFFQGPAFDVSHSVLLDLPSHLLAFNSHFVASFNYNQPKMSCDPNLVFLLALADSPAWALS